MRANDFEPWSGLQAISCEVVKSKMFRFNVLESVNVFWMTLVNLNWANVARVSFISASHPENLRKPYGGYS